MDWFTDLRHKLFGGEAPRTGQLHHGPLQRGEAFRERHAAWCGTEAAALLAHYRAQLLAEQRRGDTDLHLLRTPQAAGLQLQATRNGKAGALQHLMELLKERVLALGYRMQLADQRIGTDGLHRERYYLKPAPPADLSSGPIPQHYGNVLIECWGQDRADRHLKVLCTVYSDRLYAPPLPAEELWPVLLEGSER